MRKPTLEACREKSIDVQGADWGDYRLSPSCHSKLTDQQCRRCYDICAIMKQITQEIAESSDGRSIFTLLTVTSYEDFSYPIANRSVMHCGRTLTVSRETMGRTGTVWRFDSDKYGMYRQRSICPFSALLTWGLIYG